jgi:Uma2 family endonuclease
MSVAPTQFEPRALRYNFDEYMDLAARGMFEGKRVMLLDGEVIEMPPQGPDHVIGKMKVDYCLRRIVGTEKFSFQLAGPYRLDERNDPEPDILVRYGGLDEQVGIADNCALVVEVSDTTLSFDRKTKLPRYARSGVKEVWILNCVDRQLEVYRNPQSTGWNFAYTEALVLKAGDFVKPLCSDGAQAPVAEMMP